jgi:hypothetical protein
MEMRQQNDIEIPPGLLDVIRSFPVEREIEHCGLPIMVSPFDFYAQCPRCGTRIKLRAFSGNDEIEDVFDAVFEWMNQPQAPQAAARRQAAIRADQDD